MAQRRRTTILAPPPLREEVLFSLAERLRDRESGVRRLQWDDQEQRLRRGADDERRSHQPRHREHGERRHETDRTNRDPTDASKSSRHVLDEQERAVSHSQNGAQDELEALRQQLHAALGENEEQHRQVLTLEDMVSSLTIELDQWKKQEHEDKSLLARLGERVESHRHDRQEAQAVNEELQRRLEDQRRRSEVKADEMREMKKSRDRREDELVDDMERMRRQHNQFVDAQGRASEEREKEICRLYEQCKKYQRIIDEAEQATHEQKVDLRAKKKEVEELSMVIESSQNGGILGRLGNMCSTQSPFL